MKQKLAIGITALALSVYGGASALTSAVSNDAPDDQVNGLRAGSAAASSWANPAATVVQVTAAPPAPATPASERALSANPLWAMPLAQFAVTRDRPIFSPSRRPPPAAVAPVVVPKFVAVPKPREPERPQLTLVGTIAGDEDGFGIFLDQSTKAVLRLKVGEDFQGWKLRSVQGRETALEKDQQVVTLALPQPGLGQVTGEASAPPPNLPKLRR
jgi:general secretion pathway protein N